MLLGDQAEIARLVGASRARGTQGMGMLHLAPDIQEATLDRSPTTEGRDPVPHRVRTRIAAQPL